MNRHPAPHPAGRAGAKGTATWGRKVIGISWAVTAVVVVLGLALGLWQNLFSGDGDDSAAPPSGASGSPHASTPGDTTSLPRCAAGKHGVTLRLTGRPTRAAAHTTATLACQVGPGEHLYWLVRKETGDPARPRVHYTLRYDLGQASSGQRSYDSVLSTTSPGSKRTLCVVLLDDTTYHTVKESTDPETNYVRMPSPVPYVSNSVLITTPE